MKLKKVILENFKAYQKAEINFDEINIIVGRNDAGKSTVLHALDLFRNQNIHGNLNELFFKDELGISAQEIRIECHFQIEKNEVMIKLGDEDVETPIAETNLLDKEGKFVIGYKFTNQSLGKKEKYSECYVKCENYDISNQSWSSKKQTLEQMKKADLDKALKDLKLTVEGQWDGRENQGKRKTLESHIVTTNLVTKTDIILQIQDKADKDRLEPLIDKLPSFKLFSNDKANLTSDKEHSGVIENEVKEIITREMKPRIDEIKSQMLDKMREKIDGMSKVYGELFDFLGEDNFRIADGAPAISFKSGGIVDKKGLNIDNRGSGFRRLALLSLHLSSHNNHDNTIYAIEEPETSQNPHNQKGIINAMTKLFEAGAQIIITTHSPSMAKEFGGEKVEYVMVENDGKASFIKDFNSYDEMLKEIIKTLGILPLDIIGKKLIVFVEGPDDSILLTKINEKIFFDEEVVFINSGGSGMKFHIALNYFPTLRQIILFDKPAKDETKKIQEDALEKMGKIYPTSQKEDYSIISSKEDITEFWKLDTEESCPLKRKGLVSKIIKDFLNGDINLTKEKFYDFDEIDGWFKKFDSWKKNTVQISAN